MFTKKKTTTTPELTEVEAQYKDLWNSTSIAHNRVIFAYKRAIAAKEALSVLPEIDSVHNHSIVDSTSINLCWYKKHLHECMADYAFKRKKLIQYFHEHEEEITSSELYQEWYPYNWASDFASCFVQISIKEKKSNAET